MICAFRWAFASASRLLCTFRTMEGRTGMVCGAPFSRTFGARVATIALQPKAQGLGGGGATDDEIGAQSTSYQRFSRRGARRRRRGPPELHE